MKRLTPYQLFPLVGGLSLLAMWRDLAATAALASRSDAYTHLAIIIPIAATLALLTRRSQTIQPTRGVRTGLILLVVAAAIAAYPSLRGSYTLAGDTQLSLRMFAVVLWWIGAFVLCFGGRMFRLYAFPLCFLFWLVPLPEQTVNRMIVLLQQGSAAAAHELFTLAGVPVMQDGVLLSVPGLTIQVAAECSSIRSSLMLAVITLVLAHIFLRTIWGKIVIALAIVPLAVFKNGVRVFTIAMLGAYFDPGILDSRLHHQGGIIFLLLALIEVCALIWLIGKLERLASAPSSGSIPPSSNLAPALPAQRLSRGAASTARF